MSAEQRAAEVIVVGGGIIGCTLAYELQKRGVDTLLLERGQIAREASWASAGIIGAPTAAGLPPHRAALAEYSQKRYAALIQGIEEDSGLESTYLHIGKLLVAQTEAEVEAAQAQVNWQVNHGFEATWLEADQVREMEPIIPDNVLGAYYTDDGGAMTLHRFTETVAAAFRQRGGRISEYTPAVNIVVEGDRATGVETAQGILSADKVVLAAGAWTRFLGPAIQREFPTMPVKGQMVSVAPGPGALRPRHVVGSISGGYLVPRIDGTVAVGASLEESGFDTRLTPLGIDYALGLMRNLGPALLDASYVTGWAGLRPGTSDDTPIMGPVPGYHGLWVSTGHFRTGAQLAPGSAELMASAVVDGKPGELLKDFGLERFG